MSFTQQPEETNAPYGVSSNSSDGRRLSVTYMPTSSSDGQQAKQFAAIHAGQVHLWKEAKVMLTPSNNRTLKVLLQRPAPVLEDLTVGAVRLPGIGTWSRINLFNGDAPRLRSLTLAGVPINWNAPALTGLRILNIARYEKGQMGPTLPQLLELLKSNAQTLEEILIDSVVMDPDADLGRLDALDFPALRKLDVSDVNARCFGSIAKIIRSMPACDCFHVDVDMDKVPKDIFLRGLHHLLPDLTRIVSSYHSTTDVYDIEMAFGWKDGFALSTADKYTFTLTTKGGPAAAGIVFSMMLLSKCTRPIPLRLAIAHGKYVNWKVPQLFQNLHVTSLRFCNIKDHVGVFSYLGKPMVESGVAKWPLSDLQVMSFSQKNVTDGFQQGLVRMIKGRMGSDEEWNQAYVAEGATPQLPLAFTIKTKDSILSPCIRAQIEELLGAAALSVMTAAEIEANNDNLDDM